MRNESSPRAEIDVEHTENSEKVEQATHSLLYGVEDNPTWAACFAFAMQQFLYTVGSVASFPVILMPLLCYEDSQNVKEYRTIIASNCLLSTGISTFLQTTFGVRIPAIQGTSISYVVATMSVLSSDKWRCPDEVTQNTSMLSTVNAMVSSNFTTATTNVTDAAAIIKVYVEYDGSYRLNQDVWMIRLRMIQGSIIICGLIQVVLGATGVVGHIMKFIGPLTIAPVLALVTYALCDIIMDMCKVHWGIAIVTLCALYVTSIVMEKVLVPIPKCSFTRKKVRISTARYPIFSMFPILFSLAIGWLAYFILSMATGSNEISTTLEKMESIPWVGLPYPFRFGLPIFAIDGTLGHMVALIPTALEAIGHFIATAVICQLPPPPTHAINRGVLMGGVSTVMFGIFSVGSGSTLWTTNSTVISLSRAASRRIFQITALLIMVVSIFPKSISIFSLLPEPVVGGMLLGTLGSIIAVGVSSLRNVDMPKNRNLFVFGLSFVGGIVIPKYFATYPEAISSTLGASGDTLLILLKSPMLIAGLIGFTFDNISPGTKRERGLEDVYAGSQENDQSSTNTEVYNLPFKTNCRWTRLFPVCPSYNSVSSSRTSGQNHHIPHDIVSEVFQGQSKEMNGQSSL